MRALVLLLVLACAGLSQETLNVSRDLIRLGIAPANMIPNQPSLDAGPLLSRGVTYAQNHQIPTVIADPGSYYFKSLQAPTGHVVLNYLSNMTIDLQGSDLYFTNTFSSGIIMQHSTNVVLQNFTADYDPLPFTQVRVVSVDPTQRKVQFAVDGSWQNPTVLNAVFGVPAAGPGGIELHVFRSGRPIQGVPRLYAVNPVGSSDFTVQSQFANAAPVMGLIRPGDIVFMGMRTAAAGPVTLSYSDGCTLRNITSYSSVEWGIGSFVTKNTVFERTYSMPRPGTDRLASTYGQLEIGAGTGNQLRLNRVIRTMDNGIVYALSFQGQVKSQIDARTLIVEGGPGTNLSVNTPVPNGSTAVFQSLSDAAILGSAVVVSQTAPPFVPAQPYDVTFQYDRDLPANLVGTLAYGAEADQRGANSVIERNALEEETDCCRGFLIWGASSSSIRGNYLQRAPMAALQVENTMQFPPGAPPVSNLTIANNVFDLNNWTVTNFPTYQLGALQVDTATSTGALASVGTHENVTATGNFISQSGSSAVWIGNTNGGSVTGNYLLNSNSSPAVGISVANFGANQPVIVQASQGVTAAGNTIDQTSARVWIADGEYREFAAYAPGSTIRLNAYEIGTTLAAPTVSLTDADGVVAPAAVEASMAHALDVQIPAAAALGGAYITVTAGALKYFGTLFLDSQDNVPAVNGCTYEMSAASSSTGASANSLSVLVVTQPGCSYALADPDAFASTGATGTGTGLVSVNFSGNSGAARSTTIEIAGQPITLTQSAPGAARPVVQAIADSWTYSAGLAPGEWVTITGAGLAGGPARVWNLAGTQVLPASLGGVSVTFNGNPAALYYVSPTQINALAPAGITPGPVRVIVQVNGVNSDPFTVTATATQPAVYALPTPDAGSFFITAALAGTGTLVGNNTVDSRVLRAAQPGDLLDLYMIGLGETADPSNFITDRVFGGAYPLSAPVTVSIGGETAAVAFAGLTSPGLYLVRVTVPADLAPGPQPVQVSAGTGKTIPSLMLLVAPHP